MRYKADFYNIAVAHDETLPPMIDYLFNQQQKFKIHHAVIVIAIKYQAARIYIEGKFLSVSHD